MSHVYRITPAVDKSVEAYYNVYSKDSAGNMRGWTVTETYNYGVGYRDLKTPIYLDDTSIILENSVGLGSELRDRCGCWFEFDDSFSNKEKSEIQEIWETDGPTWLFGGDHNWITEDDRITMYGPFNVDIIDDVDGRIIMESVKLNYSDEFGY